MGRGLWGLYVAVVTGMVGDKSEGKCEDLVTEDGPGVTGCWIWLCDLDPIGPYEPLGLGIV
jgi:hypothetical protein